MLSHELRNPLAAILNAARLLEADAGHSDMDLARGIVQRQAGHMARLLDDLLDVSRITRDKIEIRRQTVDLCQVTRDALETIRPLAEARNIQLHIDLPRKPLCVSGDPARLQQIEVNLLSNAVRYTPSRGQVWLSLTAVDGEAKISVRDTGVGIPAEMHDKIFDLFVQLGRDSGSAAGGMGVGLTLVRALVNLHGGKITVASAGPGAGSAFTVTLPIVDASTLLAPRTAKKLPLSGLRVLLVEDNQDIRMVTQRLLKGMGCDVTPAENGTEAIETIKNARLDIALIDIGLPEMDGYEIARQTRKLPGAQKLKLVAVTGFGQPDDRDRALEAGFDDHLVKPVDLDQLYRLLCKLTDRPCS
jgi:two-component system CheB/CheR fusion protein